jgi:signal transduction histidine kinase
MFPPLLKRAGWTGFIAAVAMAMTAAAQPPPVVLTNAAQVRSLSPAQSAKALPVKLRGVVIDQAAPVGAGAAVILEDDSAGIYLTASGTLLADCHRSDFLEVEGVTDPGQFAPIVKVTKVRHKGTAAIPAPRPVTFQDLITGALDGQWIEISGVVHRCLGPARTNDYWRVYLAANGGMVSVRVRAPRDLLVQEDAEVRVQAVCLYQFNQRRQLVMPVLQIPERMGVEIVKPAPADPFAAPLRPADSLLQFSPENTIGHRVHVHGTVTHARTGSLIWIRDGDSGLQIQTHQTNDLAPGDLVEILGFPAYGSASPLLEDALFKKTGTGPPPAPIPATATSVFNYQDDLVAVAAVISDVQFGEEGMTLTLKADRTEFRAHLKDYRGAARIPDWEIGSRVQVAGICSVIHNEVRPLMGIWSPQSFEILMRSPADLTVQARPSWWTPSHTILVLGCIAGGLMLVSGVIMTLARHRLKEQGRQRAMAESEFAAILAERNRLAREIHDTLAQGLVATSVQLRLARKQSTGAPPALQQHIDSAQQLVQSSLQEARNSIWNMRSQVLEHHDLAAALEGILRQMANGTEVQTQFEVAGQLRRLAPVLENNLLRVGQEAITNATKHAHASRIQVKMDFGDAQFTMTVSDNGCGFDPAKSRSAGLGGFGLVGMRERISALQGKLTVHSQPGQGSEIQVVVPLFGERAA